VVVRDFDAKRFTEKREQLFLVHREVPLELLVFNAICDVPKLDSRHLVEFFKGVSHGISPC
jgi:hypothetical protein